MTIDIKPQLGYLACPQCRGLLTLDNEVLRCLSCNHKYIVRNGVPQLFPDVSDFIDFDSQHPHKSAHDFALRDRLRSTKLYSVARDFYHHLQHLDQKIAPVMPFDRKYNLKWMFDVINSNDASKVRVVLDCGGADGRYRDMMCRSSDEYWNLEVDTSVQKLRLGEMGLLGDIHHAPLQDEKFNVVVMLEVLEHLYDPFLALTECFRILKPGGFLVLTTPQYCMIHAFPCDYYRYTIHGLRFMTKRAGFKWIKHHSMGGKWLLFYFMLTRSLFPVLRQPPLNLLVNLPLQYIFLAIDTIACLVNPTENQRNPDTYGWAVLVQKPHGLQ